MNELKIVQKVERTSFSTGEIYTMEEEHLYYSADLDILFELMELAIRLAKCEIVCSIRPIEKGQVSENEE